MVQINPKLLDQEPKSNGIAKKQVQMRSSSISWIVLMKNAFTSALERTVLKVQVNNEAKYMQSLSNVQSQLATISKRLASLKINFPEIKVPATNVTVNNPDMLASADKIGDKVTSFEELMVVQFDNLSLMLNKITKHFQALEKTVRENKVAFPNIQKIEGNVKVEKVPMYDFDKLLKELKFVRKAIEDIRIDIPKQPDIKMPAMPKMMQMAEGKAILRILDEVSTKLDELPKSFPDIEFPTSVSVSNFPPQKYPMPVTNININPLRGFAKSRSITVTTSATPLPDEVLAYRRSLVVYNNSSQTLYVGGSDVTSSNGMPVPASSYSPAFDAGAKMIIYGIVASSTANVRVLELSNDNIGG